jgi:hypothetical protein
MNISKTELLEFLDDAEVIDRGKWRHGSSARYLFQREGKHYAIWVQHHPEDGMQLHANNFEVEEVVPVEKTIVVWEKAP